MALLVPKTDATGESEVSALGEGRYMWAREFAVAAQDQSDTGRSYILSVSDQGALWIPIDLNVQLSKRKRDDLADLTVPAHVRACSQIHEQKITEACLMSNFDINHASTRLL